MRLSCISILAVIISILQYSNCRKLGGEGDHHHHDHSEHHHPDSEHHHTEHHHHDASEGHHHNIHNEVDQEQEIQALESSIESVYASFDGSEDVDHVYAGSYEDEVSDNVIEDDSVDQLDRSRYGSSCLVSWLVVLTKTVNCSAIPTTLEDGTVKNCVEKLAFREELK